MKRTNIYLDEELDRWLRHLAVEQQRSFTDLVREALHEYLERRGLAPNDTLRATPSHQPAQSDQWRTEMTALLAEIRSGIPSDVSPEELEADIDAAWEEYRQEQHSPLTTYD